MRRHRYKGRLMSIRELSEASAIGISPQALRFRLDRGWPLHRALTEPIEARRDSGRRGASKTNREHARRFAYSGRKLSAAGLAALSPHGLKRQVVNERIRRGWSAGAAISTPLKR